jgi:hypothetical protein
MRPNTSLERTPRSGPNRAQDVMIGEVARRRRSARSRWAAFPATASLVSPGKRVHGR